MEVTGLIQRVLGVGSRLSVMPEEQGDGLASRTVGFDVLLVSLKTTGELG